jgi:hypothetical protein
MFRAILLAAIFCVLAFEYAGVRHDDTFALRPPDYCIEYQQANERLILAWEDQEAVVYEIQARQFTDDWHTIAWTRGTWVAMGIPMGVSQLRLRAWDLDGPRAWCKPTDFLFVFQVTPPAAEPEDDMG